MDLKGHNTGFAGGAAKGIGYRRKMGPFADVTAISPIGRGNSTPLTRFEASNRLALARLTAETGEASRDV